MQSNWEKILGSDVDCSKSQLSDGTFKFYQALSLAPTCPIFRIENLGFFAFFIKMTFLIQKVFFGHSVSIIMLNGHLHVRLRPIHFCEIELQIQDDAQYTMGYERTVRNVDKNDSKVHSY